MLTLIETLSLAGDRAKQNDDACGFAHDLAWVIDGATDLHEAPVASAATDAAWLAQCLTVDLAAAARGAPYKELTLRAVLRDASLNARTAFDGFAAGAEIEPWRAPLASALMVGEVTGGVLGLDLGDCRAFALQGDGAACEAGGPQGASDRESEFAAQTAAQVGAPADGALYRAAPAREALRKLRAAQNLDPKPSVFNLNPDCAAQARAWTLTLMRPAHILLCTDGLSALVDRYEVYDAAGIVTAARERGLQELGRELRAIENADASGAKHPRFKRSDDATGVLLRFS